MQSSDTYCSLTHLSLLHVSPVKNAHNFQDAHLDRKLAVFFQQLIQRLMWCAVFWCAAMRHFSCCCLTYGEQSLKYLPSSQRWKWNRRGCAVVHIPFNGIDRLAFLFVHSFLVARGFHVVPAGNWAPPFNGTIWKAYWVIRYLTFCCLPFCRQSNTSQPQLNLCQFPFNSSELIIMRDVIILQWFILCFESANIYIPMCCGIWKMH